MKRKNSNKTGIIAAVVGLSAVSLVSVGFASWIISGGDSYDVSGSITVDDVTDSRYLIDKTNEYKPSVTYASGGAIVFGAPASSDTGWLKNDSATKENLRATIVFYVANLTGKTKGTDYDLSGSIEAVTKASEFNAAVAANLVKFPTITANSSFVVDPEDYHETTVDGEKNIYTKVSLVLDFEWGSYFGGANPYAFYNAKAVDGASGNGDLTWGGDAKQKLNLIHAADGASFKVTLTTAAHSQQA